MIGNKKFQNALAQIPQEVPPIWFMRQAGRYHSHYQNLRKTYSFEELCKTSDLAAEVAMGPIQDFDFDVAILFSDILFPLEALGMGLHYSDAGPQLGFQLDHDTLKKLKPASEACEFLNFQSEGVLKTRARLSQDKSLIGFVGGIWTLFVYASEGGHSGSLIKAKKNLPLFKHFSESMIQLHAYTIRRQLEAGAEVVHIFDTAAGEISPELFRQFVVPSLSQLCQMFPGKLGYYSKGTMASYFDQKFFDLPWAGLGYDHRWNLPQVCLQKKHRGFLQGNFDQALLHADTDDLKKYLENYLQEWKKLSPEQRVGWVSGLGHGILPKTPEKHVHLFIEMVRRWL